MKKRWDGKFLYYFGGIILSLFLCVGLVHMITGGESRDEKTELAESSQEKKSGEQPGEKEKENQKEKETDGKADKTVIRVLLRTNGYAGEVHPNVSLSAAGGLTLEGTKEKRETKEGESVTIAPADTLCQGGTIRVRPKKEGENITISSLKRGSGIPSYRGELELYQTAQGIAVINELPLESYLYAVVPSEMPASYEEEALKAQAVCARSYAYCHMEGQAYPEYRANVDDSTAYQVYGNSKEQEKTIAAVDATRGEKLLYQGKVVKAYYFSTSCGRTTNVEAWGTKVSDANSYLKAVKVEEEGVCYEQDLPWFSWNCDIPVDTLSNLFGLNTGQDVGTISQIEITRRGEGEVALEMKVTGDKGTATIQTENKIRSALGGSGYEIKKQDGSVAASAALLPSAFFTIEKNGASFHLEGGGYGHGIGMSQNGANEMAKRGKDYKAILKMFYNGVEIAAN